MQNAAGIVSISTVALIVPRSRPSASSAITNASRQSAASCWRLQLGDVEVRPPAALEQRLGVAVHVQAEVHERAGHRLAVELEVRSGRCRPRGRTCSTARVVLELVVLALLVVLDLDRGSRRPG